MKHLSVCTLFEYDEGLSPKLGEILLQYSKVILRSEAIHT